MDDKIIAAVLLREWWAHGVMLDVLAACGVRVHQLESAELPSFMPRDVTAYYRHKLPRYVREAVGTMYPSLQAWLFRRASLADCVPAIDQVVRLHAPDKFSPQAVLDREFTRDRAEYRLAQKTKELVRAIEGTHKRSAWNVVKATGRNKRA